MSPGRKRREREEEGGEREEEEERERRRRREEGKREEKDKEEEERRKRRERKVHTMGTVCVTARTFSVGRVSSSLSSAAVREKGREMINPLCSIGCFLLTSLSQ